MTPVRILLVDDQLLFRKGLRALLEDQEDMEVVGEASDGLMAVEHVRSSRPDVVLMDIHMPVCNGAEATRLIKSEWPETKDVVLTISDEDEELFELLQGVLRGETPISPAVAGKLLTEFRQRPRRESAQTAAWDLTARELEILQLVAEGFSNAEIAARLFIVEGTAKNHLHNILDKLHLENRVQAATYAIRQGLVEPPPEQPRGP